MQNRRQFLKNASLMLAGTLVAPQLMSACAAPKKNIGLQLYSLRAMVKDQGIRKVLEAVAKIGYTAVENAGYNDGLIYGLAPTEFKKICDDLGLKCTSAHVGRNYSKENPDEVWAWWDKCIEAHNAVGVKYLVQPSMPVNERSSLDDLQTYCDYFNNIGMKTAAASIAFGYHNHSFEFKTIDGNLIYDYMLAHTSPNHVNFELDVYWCQVGGGSPVKYLTDYANRYKCIHIKDEKEIGASGKMDFKAIFDQMKADNIKDWYVEVEQYTNNDPLASVKQSYDFLAKADYVY